jgi:hypothetical protein
VDCRYDLGRTIEWQQLAALSGYAKGAAQQGLRSSRAETHHHFRLHQVNLYIEPRAAGGNLE